MLEKKPPTLHELEQRQADLKRQAKELAARSEYLDDREHLLKSGPLDLTVLEETIHVKTEQLKQLKSRFAVTEESNRKRLRRLDADNMVRQADLKARVETVKSLEQSIKTHEGMISLRTSNIKKLEAEIAERKQYLTQQEKVIAEAIDEGNATLRGIGFEIQAAQEKRDQIVQDIAATEVKKTEVGYELVQLEDRHRQDVFADHQELERIREKIHEANVLLTDIHTQAEQAKASVDDKMHQLSIREQEIMTKQGALIRERNDLETDKRRWNSTKSLYGGTL